MQGKDCRPEVRDAPPEMQWTGGHKAPVLRDASSMQNCPADRTAARPELLQKFFPAVPWQASTLTAQRVFNRGGLED